MTSVPERLTLIFDGECGFCTRSARIARSLDRRGRVTIVPYQKPGVLAAHGLTEAQAAATVWAVAPDDRRYAGAAAVAQVLSVALGTRLPWLVYRIPGMSRLQERVYDWVARNRGRLPGDQPYCEQHPEECGAGA
ncbi:MAG TPA: DUF393 domain-containing protein [Thermomicrobiales bacterium]